MIRSILDWLEQTAARLPDKTAFADEAREITFAQLEARARRIGSHLAALLPPRSPVVLYMDKRVEAIEAYMGTVYAGCFYVVLEPSQPLERTQTILGVLGCELILADDAHLERARELGAGRVVRLEDAAQTPEDASHLASIRAQALDTDPLYAMFTSGSTGVPKGVLVSHRSVLDFIDQYAALFGIGEADVIGNQAPLDFDVSVKDIYTGLRTGAKVFLIPRRFFSLPARLLDCLCDQRITVLTWAVSALCILSTLGSFKYKVPQDVRLVLFSGEVMPVRHLNIWRSHLPQATFVNLYGPTEITCNCMYYVVDREFTEGERLPLGKPFPNERILLLDEENRPVTCPGAQGEICVSGSALALGYYNNPERTAQAFVQNPLNTRYIEMIYRTGDLAEYGESGELYYVGRKDFQIKHNGHRIELGEVEMAAGALPGVERACCAYDEAHHRLYLFYQGPAQKADVQRGLREKLPQVMLPNALVPMDALPITKNGKIDRQALRAEFAKGR